MNDPPGEVCHHLDEAVTLLSDLEIAREALAETEALSPLAGVEHQIVVLDRKLFHEGGGG